MRIRPLPQPIKQERATARRLFRNALAKHLIVVRNVCEHCGRRWDKRHSRLSMWGVEAHHPDYAQPLQVVWLCHWCHIKADTAMRAALKALPPPVPEIYPTHCRHGHEMVGENIHLDKWGYRSCRTCTRKATEAAGAKQRLATIARRAARQAAGLRVRRIACALALTLAVAVPLQAQDRVGPAPYTVLIVGQVLDLTTTLEALHSTRGKEGNPLWSSAGTAGFVVIKTSSALAIGFAMHQLASHGHPRAAKVLGYSAGFALMGVGISNARVGR